MTIDISTIDLERAVEMVLTAFGSRFGRLPGEGGEPLASGSGRMGAAE